MSYLYMLVGVYALYLILKLHWMTALAVLVCCVAGYPFVRKAKNKCASMYAHFTETCLYLETMLHAFSKEGKIQSALEDAVLAVGPGPLHETLSEAEGHLMMTFDESEVTEDSLRIIEEKYPCKRVKNLHSFMLHVEYYGGDMKDAVHLMDEERRRWELRILDTIEDRKKGFREVVMSVLASLVICGCVLHMPVIQMDISVHPVIQVLAFVMLLLDTLILFRAYGYLHVDWSNLDIFEDGEQTVERLARYRNYNPKKEQKASFVLGGIVALCSIPAFAYGKYWIALGIILLAMVFLNQHKIAHRLQSRALLKEIKSAFPNWLIDLTLLLQTENVQVAIQKSLHQAPDVLQADIEQLEQELMVDPESSRPYHRFLTDFKLPQISSAMSMLFSLSMGNSENGRQQLMELVDGNYQLLDEAEKVRLRDKSSGMYLLFLAPVLIGSLKLVVDMAIFMLSFVNGGFGLGGVGV